MERNVPVTVMPTVAVVSVVVRVHAHLPRMQCAVVPHMVQPLMVVPPEVALLHARPAMPMLAAPVVAMTVHALTVLVVSVMVIPSLVSVAMLVLLQIRHICAFANLQWLESRSAVTSNRHRFPPHVNVSYVCVLSNITSLFSIFSNDFLQLQPALLTVSDRPCCEQHNAAPSSVVQKSCISSSHPSTRLHACQQHHRTRFVNLSKAILDIDGNVRYGTYD